MDEKAACLQETINKKAELYLSNVKHPIASSVTMGVHIY